MNNFIKKTALLLAVCCALFNCNSYENEASADGALIIHGFYADDKIHHAGESVNVHVVLHGNPPAPIKYHYQFIASSGSIITNGASAKVTLNTGGVAILKATVTDGKGRIASKTLALMGQSSAPIITSFTASSYSVDKNTSTTLIVAATDPDFDAISYTYSVSTNLGSVSNGIPNATYTAGGILGGDNIITVTAKDSSGAESTASLTINTPKSTAKLGGISGGIGGASGVVDVAIDQSDNVFILKKSGTTLTYYSLPISPRAISNEDVTNNYTISVPEMGYAKTLRFHNNIMYTAYRTTTTWELRLKKYDGNSWETITTSCSNITNFAFELDSNGVPHFAIQDPKSGGANYSVIRYNGTSWDLVGTRGIFPATATPAPRFPVLLFDSSEQPVVATQISNRITVAHYNGSSWTLTGTGLGSDGSRPTEGATANNGDLYISMSGGFGANGVLLYNGSSWTRDLSTITGDQTRDTGVKVAPDGTIWAFARVPYNIYGRIRYKPPGGSWTSVPNSTINYNSSPTTRHVIDSKNNHYYIDYVTGFGFFSYQ